jgi:hypothetical protein
LNMIGQKEKNPLAQSTEKKKNFLSWFLISSLKKIKSKISPLPWDYQTPQALIYKDSSSEIPGF